MYKILNYTFPKLPLEELEQEYLVIWLNKQNIDHFAPMNENKQSYANRRAASTIEAKAKKMGKKEGVSDLFIYLPKVLLHIELKRQKPIFKNGNLGVAKNKPTESQLEFLETVEKYPYAKGFVAYGCNEAIKIIEEFRRIK